MNPTFTTGRRLTRYIALSLLILAATLIGSCVWPCGFAAPDAACKETT